MKSLKIITTPLLLVVLFFTLTSCQHKRENQRLVSVSILPQKYFIERIAGDYLQINVMIPPGMNPATCDLNSGQLKKLYDSDLCFTIGNLPFELTHLYPTVKNLPHLRVVNHSENIKLLSGGCGHGHDAGHEHGGVDPHIWLSPRYARQMADTIYEVLSKQYPDQQETFETNYRAFVGEINSLATRAAQVLGNKKDKVFLIYHPALTYWAADYGMEQISIEDEGKEPHPSHLKKIIDTAREKHIHIIFIQSQFDAGSAESVARQIGGQVMSFDPLAENWTAELHRLIGIFDEYLENATYE